MGRLLILLSFALPLLFAQDSLPVPDLSGLAYPALAGLARIQGTVHFDVHPSGVEIISGHPLLRQAALANVEKWAQNATSSFLVDYIFQIDDRVPVSNKYVEVEYPVGDSLDRFFLRIFHRPTTRKGRTRACVADISVTSVSFVYPPGAMPRFDIKVSIGACLFETTSDSVSRV